MKKKQTRSLELPLVQQAAPRYSLPFIHCCSSLLQVVKSPAERFRLPWPKGRRTPYSGFLVATKDGTELALVAGCRVMGYSAGRVDNMYHWLEPKMALTDLH